MMICFHLKLRMCRKCASTFHLFLSSTNNYTTIPPTNRTKESFTKPTNKSPNPDHTSETKAVSIWSPMGCTRISSRRTWNGNRRVCFCVCVCPKRGVWRKWFFFWLKIKHIFVQYLCMLFLRKGQSKHVLIRTLIVEGFLEMEDWWPYDHELQDWIGKTSADICL